MELCANVLSDDPLFWLISSYTAGLSPSVSRYMLASIMNRRFGGTTECDELGLPVSETGLCLPCGSSARWIRNK